MVENEWETEPNEKQWIAKDTGFRCLIRRHGDFGHLCGYVGIERGHPLFGKSYPDLYDCGDDISVHGGLTFADFIENHGGKEIWWFGFDCGHSYDYIPHIRLGILMSEGTYRNIEYVENEVNNLAEQLSNKLKWLVLVGMGPSKKVENDD